MKHITVIGQMIECGITDKSAYLPVLQEADKEILQFSQEMNFVYEEPINLFHQTTDERLSATIEKQNKASENPELTIQECVKKKLAILDSFINKYHIGFIRSAEVSENGYVKVEIPCSIHSSFVSDDRESAKATFDAQINLLKEIGIDIINTKNFGWRICRTENNLNILEKMLKDRGCTQVRFSTVDNSIDKIKCVFNVTSIENFSEKPINIIFETNDTTLNKDEIGKVFKYVKEILSAKSSISFLGDTIRNTCCSLIESYFSYICQVFNFDGEITKRVNGRHESERNKNIEIQNIEANIGNSVAPEKFKEVLTMYKEKLEKFTLETLSFRVSDFSIDRYGFVCCSLHFTCSNWLNEFKLASEEFLRENFKMSLGNQDDETLTMLDTYENKLKIQQMLKEFCQSARITDVKSGVRDGCFYISEIRVIIDNITNIR